MDQLFQFHNSLGVLSNLPPDADLGFLRLAINAWRGQVVPGAEAFASSAFNHLLPLSGRRLHLVVRV
jgi:hypothetical protein